MAIVAFRVPCHAGETTRYYRRIGESNGWRPPGDADPTVVFLVFFSREELVGNSLPAHLLDRPF
jgi:hypothetical protein